MSGWSADQLPPSMDEKLKRKVLETYEVVRAAQERDRADDETVCRVDLPAQSLTVPGETTARNVLRMLKGVGVRGTYRMARRGGGADGGR